MNFDDRPVGGGGGNAAMQIGEYADEQEDFSSLSLEQKLLHSNWKARQEGFDEVKPSSQSVSLLCKNLGKICCEGNASAQLSLLECMLRIVLSGSLTTNDDNYNAIVSNSIPFCIEKGITGRPKIVESSTKLVVSLVGLGSVNEVFQHLLPAFSHKVPRNRLSAAQLCGELVKEFGIQHFPSREIIKAMQPLFNDANPQVRKEASNLCCQCYRFMGAGIKSALSDLRDVQLQELESKFENLTLGGNPPRRIRGYEDATPTMDSRAVKPIGKLVGPGGNVDVDDDTFTSLEESAILQRLPRKFFHDALDKNVSWQDRCACVSESLMPLLAVAKFRAKDDYHELASMMRIYLLDPQAPPMLLGFKMIQECARGLRSAFGPYARNYVVPLFDKMKDKKTSVLEHVMQTLEKLVLYHCLTVDNYIDEMDQITQGKNPTQRLASMNFCVRLLKSFDSTQFVKFGKSTTMLQRMVNDEKAGNRDVAYVILQSLMRMFGEQQFSAVLSSMDAKQRSRLIEVGSKLETPVEANSGNQDSSPSKSPAKKVQRVEDADSASEHISSKPLSRVSNHGGQSSHINLDDGVSLESTLPAKMDAPNTVLGLLGGDIAVLELLRSSDWSKRLQGVEKVKSAVERWTPTSCSNNLNAVLVCLRNYPGFDEANLQVFQVILAIFSTFLSKASFASPGACYALITGFGRRAAEPKARLPIRELITTIANLYGARFVVKHLTFTAATIRTNKLLQECNEICLELISSGKNGKEVDAKSLVDYVKICHDVSPSLRASSIELLVMLRTVAGSSVDKCVSTLSEPALAMYEQAAARKGIPAARDASQRNSRAESSLPAQNASSNQKRHRNSSQSPSPTGLSLPKQRGTKSACASPRPSSGDQLLSLKPILGEICSGDDWRNRLRGVRHVEDYISNSGGKISGSDAEAILRALQSRFDEVNKNFVVDVLRLIPVVVEAGGLEECASGLRKLLPGAFAMLGDQKAVLRDEARKVVFLGVEAVGIANLLPTLQKPLSCESNAGRQGTLEAMIFGFQNLGDTAPISRPGLQLLVPGVTRALMDRIQEVRAAAEQVIRFILPILGSEVIFRFVAQLKPADQQLVTPAIERQMLICAESLGGQNLHPDNEEESGRDVQSQLPAAYRDVETPVSASRASLSRKTPQKLHSRDLCRDNEERSSDAPKNNEVHYSIPEITVGLRSATTGTAQSMCSDFLKRCKAGEAMDVTTELIQVMTARLHDNTRKLEPVLAMTLIECLSEIFVSDATQLCDSAMVSGLVGIIFDCLLSDQFSLNDRVIKSLNNMTLRLLEGCPANSVFNALLSRMASYSATYLKSGNRNDLKFIQVTVKCIMRVDLSLVSRENIILCCNEYLLQHPPTSFRELDDLPIRTVKTILQNATKRSGKELLAMSNQLVGSENLVTRFIRGCIEAQEKSTMNKSSNEIQVAEEIKQQRASESPVPRKTGARISLGHVDPTSDLQSERSFPSSTCIDRNSATASGRHTYRSASKLTEAAPSDIAAIFSKIRSHVTSSEGIDDLYNYLHVHDPSDFESELNTQFNRCSEAFRVYIKKKLQRKLSEDANSGDLFHLPPILQAS